MDEMALLHASTRRDVPAKRADDYHATVQQIEGVGHWTREHKQTKRLGGRRSSSGTWARRSGPLGNRSTTRSTSVPGSTPSGRD